MNQTFTHTFYYIPINHRTQTGLIISLPYLRRVWRSQKGNQYPSIDRQTGQWPKEKEQKDKQRSAKHTH